MTLPGTKPSAHVLRAAQSLSEGHSEGRGLCRAVVNMSDTGRPRYLDSDTPRYHRKRPEFKRQKQFARRKCSWALCLPVSALLLVAAYLYLKGRPADVSHWGHTSTPNKNLTYWYKVGRAYSCTSCHWSACLHTQLLFAVHMTALVKRLQQHHAKVSDLSQCRC